MDPLLSELPIEAVRNLRKHFLTQDRVTCLRALRLFYLYVLVEDPINGSAFDKAVLETLEEMELTHA